MFSCSQIYFRFSSYLLRKTAFICNIDRDWMIYRKHPIRSLLTSMLSIVKGIIDGIIKTAVKTAEVDEQKTKYLQHFVNKHDTIVSN
jgi:hypothetical protein